MGIKPEMCGMCTSFEGSDRVDLTKIILRESNGLDGTEETYQRIIASLKDSEITTGHNCHNFHVPNFKRCNVLKKFTPVSS